MDTLARYPLAILLVLAGPAFMPVHAEVLTMPSLSVPRRVETRHVDLLPAQLFASDKPAFSAKVSGIDLRPPDVKGWAYRAGPFHAEFAPGFGHPKCKMPGSVRCRHQ